MGRQRRRHTTAPRAPSPCPCPAPATAWHHLAACTAPASSLFPSPLLPLLPLLTPHCLSSTTPLALYLCTCLVYVHACVCHPTCPLSPATSTHRAEEEAGRGGGGQPTCTLYAYASIFCIPLPPLYLHTLPHARRPYHLHAPQALHVPHLSPSCLHLPALLHALSHPLLILPVPMGQDHTYFSTAIPLLALPHMHLLPWMDYSSMVTETPENRQTWPVTHASLL